MGAGGGGVKAGERKEGVVVVGGGVGWGVGWGGVGGWGGENLNGYGGCLRCCTRRPGGGGGGKGGGVGGWVVVGFSTGGVCGGGGGGGADAGYMYDMTLQPGRVAYITTGQSRGRGNQHIW